MVPESVPESARPLDLQMAQELVLVLAQALVPELAQKWVPPSVLQLAQELDPEWALASVLGLVPVSGCRRCNPYPIPCVTSHKR